MATTTSLSFSASTQFSERKATTPSTRLLGSNFNSFRLRMNFAYHSVGVQASNSNPKMAVQCMPSVTGISHIIPVSETKLNFLKAYKRPIPSIYIPVLQELLVQQHLMRYKRSYRYDPVFALGFVTVYDQLMEGYPSVEDRDAMFKAYVEALRGDSNQYRFYFLWFLSQATTPKERKFTLYTDEYSHIILLQDQMVFGWAFWSTPKFT